MASDKTVDVFSLPYFMRKKRTGELISRASVVFEALCSDGGLEAAQRAPNAAEWARKDFEAALALCYDRDDQRLLSEAVLSALALGVQLTTTPIGESLARAICRVTRSGLPGCAMLSIVR